MFKLSHTSSWPDDEPGLRELLKRWLSSSGYDTLEAPSAEDAIDVLMKSPDIKVVIADVQMPGLGGAWLVEEVHRLFPATAVILATADASLPGTTSLKPGVISYLVKPLAGESVLAAVAEGIRWSDQHAKRRGMAEPPDPIESFLDKKLTRNHGDGQDRS